MPTVGLNLWDAKERGFRFLRYIKTVCGAVFEAVILIIFAFAAYTFLLYFAKMLWNVYIATDVGRYYVASFPIPARRTAMLLGGNILQFSLWVTILAFAVCMVSSALCRVFHIARMLYINRGTPGRIIFCGLPLAIVVARLAQTGLGIPEWGTAYAYSLVPTLIVFSRCIEIAGRLFPEIGDVLSAIRNIFSKK